MGITNLEYMFNPKSVAVIGATNEALNPGNIVMRNIMTGGFLGPVMPVSGEVEAIAGVLTYPSVQKLPKTPDLAIVCNPLPEVPEILMRLKEFGTKAVVLLASGYAGMDEEERADVAHTIQAVANPPEVRILGPKCLGFMVPSINLYASIAHAKALPGRIAFISQSDSLYTAVLDWAMSQGIGFSHIVSLGRRLDVGFSDILDYLGSDPLTRSILLYVESTHDARAFMSAARAASRNKPVVVMRPGLALREVQARLSEAATESDDVYDVAFRRAGMLRVDSIDGLFDAAQTLAQPKPVRGDRLAILTNGGSAGIQAADALLRGGGRLVEIAAESAEATDKALAGSWSRANPVGLPYNAGAKEYAEALKILVKDPGVDAVLVMHVPFAGLPDEGLAQAVAEAVKRVKRMVLASWLGSGAAGLARARLSDEDLRLRFFGVVRRDFGHKDMARFTQIDYDREMAFISTAPDERGRPETLGVVRTSTKPDNSEAEFAIVIRSNLKGSGLGSLLFQKMIRYTASRGTLRISGQTLVENKAMQGLSRKFDFAIHPDPHDESMVDMVLELPQAS